MKNIPILQNILARMSLRATKDDDMQTQMRYKRNPSKSTRARSSIDVVEWFQQSMDEE